MKSNPGRKGGSCSQYKGVRMRKWGRWVAEVRQPNSRSRIWLGSYQTDKEAARAYDAGVVCLRGPSASLNFPEDPPPDISTAPDCCLSTSQIQVAAAKHARRVDDAVPIPAAGEDDVIDLVVFDESSDYCQIGAAGDQCYFDQLSMETVIPPSTAEVPERDDSDHVSQVVF